jgi:DNA-binding transcriptional LysR family regulator
MVDFDWYRSFLAIYRSGTVSGAAEARYLTQPAVSQHLAALEAALGVPLFKRTPRRMIPTEHGKALYSQVAQAVDSLEQVALRFRETGPDERSLLRLGTPLEYFYEQVLERLAGVPLRLWVRFGETPALLEALERGELDFVIATQRLPAQAIEYIKLADERFILIGSPEKQMPASQENAEASLANIERWLASNVWLSYGTELPIIRRFWQQTFHQRPEIQPALVIPDLRAIVKAVELGWGISILPAYLCQTGLLSGRLHILWEPPQPVSNELWVAYRRIDQTDKNIQQIRMLLQTGAARSAPQISIGGPEQP